VESLRFIKSFSEPLAVLAGDSLIVLAFEILARQKHYDPLRGDQFGGNFGQANGHAKWHLCRARLGKRKPD
jgi:hypothetical protein